jgi:hypothetical protein
MHFLVLTDEYTGRRDTFVSPSSVSRVADNGETLPVDGDDATTELDRGTENPLLFK